MNKEIGLENGKALAPAEEARLEALLSHLERLLPDALQRRAFRQSSQTPPPPCLRLNPLVPLAERLRPLLRERAQPVPWCPDAFVLPGDKVLGHTLEFALGAFYVQAKAPTLAVEVLAPRPGERVLDLCAAPGGKATQIAARLQNSGLLVVNEPRSKRMPALVGHLERCGASNYLVSRAPGTLLARYFHNFFDRVLVDAPCSGDGILRKDLGMLRYWSPLDASRQAQVQTGLLRAAFHMLRPGGILVYSTCSLSTEENEQPLLGLIKRYGEEVEILPVDDFDGPPLPAEVAALFPPAFARCARVWPHLHDTEGAFVARLRKRGETWWPQRLADAEQWMQTPPPDPALEAQRLRLEEQWQFALEPPPGQIIARHGRYLCTVPACAAAFREHFPHYVRSGLRLGRAHRDHYYLTQQALTAWGHCMQGPSLDLDWEKVQKLFRGESPPAPPAGHLRGEVLCRLEGTIVCRALLRDGLLQSMVPREHLRPDLQRLF